MTKKISMEVVHPHAAGIDVGSRFHVVAIGQGKNNVREFGVYNEDLLALTQWLLDNDVTHVAMESTGTYWQNLFSILQEAGLTVTLCNGKFTKNIQGKKTDVIDCQWIQKLHTLDLLTTSYLPDSITEQLRTFCRHRQNLVDNAAHITLKMQQYLRLLNLRLDVVVTDVTGLTGMAIIEAVCNGEKNPEQLASLRNHNCKKSEEEIAKALQSNGRADFLFALKQQLHMYKEYQKEIAACDVQIGNFINTSIKPEAREHTTTKKPHKRINKNSPKGIDLNQLSYKYFEGVDLMAIEGVSHATVLTLMSELGNEGIKKFPTPKHFCKHCRLSPNTKVSGGTVISSHTPKGSNRIKIALRNAANVIGKLKEGHLATFFKRIAYRKDKAAAITATARKLAVVIWHMLTKKTSYQPPIDYLYRDEKRKKGLIKNISKQIQKFNITANELNLELLT